MGGSKPTDFATDGGNKRSRSRLETTGETGGDGGGGCGGGGTGEEEEEDGGGGRGGGHEVALVIACVIDFVQKKKQNSWCRCSKYIYILY